MRVLLPVHIFLPEQTAGVEQYTAQLASALQGEAEVAVITTRKIISLKTGTVRNTQVEGLTVYEVVNNLSYESVEGTWSEPQLEQAFSQVLDDFKPEVVHFQHLMYWSAGLPALASKAGAKVFMTLHDFWLMCARMGQLVAPDGTLCHLPTEELCAPCMAATQFGQSPDAQKWIRRLIRIRSATGIALDEPMRLAKRVMKSSKRNEAESAVEDSLQEWQASYQDRQTSFLALQESVDLFLTPSNSLRDRFIEWGLPAAKIRQLAQGRNHAPFENKVQHAEAAINTRAIRFGFLGTVAPHKGVLELIQAFAKVKSDGAQLAVYGPYAKHPEYWQLVQAEAAKDPRVELAGPVTPTQVPAVLRSFDLSCVPSLWDECCPLTIQEAFMAGTPALVSNLGGLAELVQDGKGGGRAPAGDIVAWSRTLQGIVDNPDQLSDWKRSIPTVPNIKAHVDALLQLYG